MCRCCECMVCYECFMIFESVEFVMFCVIKCDGFCELFNEDKFCVGL